MVTELNEDQCLPQINVSRILNSTLLATSVVNALVSTLVVNISVLDSSVNTSVLDLVSTLVSIPLVGTIQIFTASPTISTIVSILDSKALTSRIVEPKVQPSIRLLSKRKEI